MPIKVKLLNEYAKMPYRANPSDAGADLFASEDAIIQPLERKAISTGLSMEIPSFSVNNNYYGRIAPRSGHALKSGIDVLAGVVDASYRGEIKVILLNTDKNSPFKISKGDKIAQLIIEACFNFDFEKTEDLTSTARGSGGFGSTGK